MNKKILGKIEEELEEIEEYSRRININQKNITQLLQEEEQEYKWICKECVTRCYAPFGNKPDTCIYSYIAFQKWQPIKKKTRKRLRMNGNDPSGSDIAIAGSSDNNKRLKTLEKEQRIIIAAIDNVMKRLSLLERGSVIKT